MQISVYLAVGLCSIILIASIVASQASYYDIKINPKATEKNLATDKLS